MQILQKKITWNQFKDMDIPEGDTSIYELINGEVVKRASPNSPHQRTSINILEQFLIYNRGKKYGSFFHAPFDVYFDEESAGVQPDILFVSKKRDFIIREDNGIVGSPDLVVEIVSKGSVDKDREIKKNLYERFAVKEYWIVDPLYKTIEVYKMKNDRYTLHSFAEIKGKISSIVLQKFRLDLSDVFT